MSGASVLAVTAWDRFLQMLIIGEVIDELTLRLSPSRYPYHNVTHTVDVVHEVLLLFVHDHLKDLAQDGQSAWHELELLAVASAYHDAGYLRAYDKNEVHGAAMAAVAMRRFGYREDDIVRVHRAIICTEVTPLHGGGLHQGVKPADGMLARYLADADLGNLGRDDFPEKTANLYEELVVQGKIPIDTTEARLAFLRSSVALLRNHSYYTDAARALREPTKQANLRELEQDLKEVQGG